jgi:hypothetical protein
MAEIGPGTLTTILVTKLWAPKENLFFANQSDSAHFFGDNFIDYRAKMALHIGDLCFC